MSRGILPKIEGAYKLIELDLKFIFMNIDFLIYVPFIEEKKDLNLDFRGSSNQNIINLDKH